MASRSAGCISCVKPFSMGAPGIFCCAPNPQAKSYGMRHIGARCLTGLTCTPGQALFFQSLAGGQAGKAQPVFVLAHRLLDCWASGLCRMPSMFGWPPGAVVGIRSARLDGKACTLCAMENGHHLAKERSRDRQWCMLCCHRLDLEYRELAPLLNKIRM